MADAESRARWEFARRAACIEARRGLAPTNGDGDASPRPIRISASGGAPWQPARWRRAFMELFLLGAGGGAHGSQQDDLLFFVPLDDEAAAMHSSPPLVVRRRGTAPPPELRDGSVEAGGIDWRASVLLNLVLQTGYLLSIATCGRGALPDVGQSRNTQPGMRQVVTPVYASPMRVAVNLDSSRAADAAPAPAYPDICFALDAFDETQHHMVLNNPEQCYAVVLSAVDGPALPPPTPTIKPAAAAAVSRSPAADGPGSGGGGVGGAAAAAAANQASAAAGAQPTASAPTKQQQQLTQTTPLPGPDQQPKPQPGQQARVSPRRLEPQWAPASAEAEARRRQQEAGSGGGPSEGVTLWEYVSEGGAATTPIDSRTPAPEPGSPESIAALERAFSDPLISPSRRQRPPPGSPKTLPDGSHRSLDALDSGTGDLPGVTIFAGYVSCEQLQGVVGSSHARAAAAWAGRDRDTPHRVVMRGPGGQGFADVAVSVVRQQEVGSGVAAEADLGHLTLDDRAGSGNGGGGGRSGSRKKGKLLARVAAGAAGVAAQLARGVARDMLGGDEGERRPLRCGLMSLSTPIDLLLREMLAGWPDDAAEGTTA